MPVFLTFVNTRLKFGMRAYKQAVGPGITRPLRSSTRSCRCYQWCRSWGASAPPKVL